MTTSRILTDTLKVFRSILPVCRRWTERESPVYGILGTCRCILQVGGLLRADGRGTSLVYLYLSLAFFGVHEVEVDGLRKVGSVVCTPTPSETTLRSTLTSSLGYVLGGSPRVGWGSWTFLYYLLITTNYGYSNFTKKLHRYLLSLLNRVRVR